jgi:predicted ATPase/Tfp pilus assembly protein PilF
MPSDRTASSAARRPGRRRTKSSLAPTLAGERDEFVGRDGELRELFALWDARARLCSIVGTGGSGKTRLALHFAHLLRASSRAVAELTFCDLSDADSGLDLLNAVAWASDVTLPRRGNTEALVAHLGQVLARRGRTLLVLDNTEHLLGVARGMLESWLDLAPELSLLVTTRERLRVPGEQSITLGPLALPDPSASPNDILDADSVRLFLARARAVHRDFPASPEFAPMLAELVVKLEGLPLAIELCAARSGVLGPAELLGRIERRLETLVNRGSMLPRHATLRAALDWSWQLLDAEQQRALAQCSVFRGGFDLPAAEAVLEVGNPPLDVLEALIDKSLIKVQDDIRGQRRYSLLESVCELCDEKVDPAERAAAEERHARYYLALAEPWAERALRTGCVKSRELLELESHNLLAVHARALERSWPVRSLGAALSLEPLFARRGPLGRFIALLDSAIEATGDTVRDLLSRRAWLARGIAKRSAGDCAGALSDLERARESAADKISILALAQLGVAHLVLQQHETAEERLSLAASQAASLGDDFATGQVHAAYAILRGAQERFDDAFDHDRRAAAHFRRCGATSEEAIMLFFRGYLHLEQGSLAEAEHHLSAGLRLLRDIGERRLEAHALADLGMLRIEQGRFDEAAKLLRSALEIATNVGDDHCRGLAHGYAGQNELERGALEQSRQQFELAIQVLEEVGDRRWVAHFRAALACVETLLGRAVHGHQLFEEAERELDQAGKGDDRLVLQGWRAICAARQPEGTTGDGRVQDLREQARAFLCTLPSKTHFHWRAVCRVLRTTLESSSTRRLLVSPDASWFELGGERVSLARRGSLRRILLALVRAHEAEPSAMTDAFALFDAGWPGQHIQADSSAHRVHVAIGTLRKLGLGALLVTRSEGYALDRDLLVERSVG